MSEFRAGDIVEVIRANYSKWRADPPPVRVGMRGTVINPASGFLDYVEIDYGLSSLVLSDPRCIRKVPPDSIDSADPLKVVRWTDCPWKPARITT